MNIYQVMVLRMMRVTNEESAEGAKTAAGAEEEEPVEGTEPPAGAEEGEPVQRPFRIVAKAPVEDINLYREKGSSTQPNLSIVSGQSQQLEWKVIPESNPLSDEEDDQEELGPGLKNLSEITRFN